MLNPKPSLLERLTGGTIDVSVTGRDGRPVTASVSRKWYDAMVAEGKIRPVEPKSREAQTHSADPLSSQAEGLVDAARIAATTTWVQVMDSYPFLTQAHMKQWDFFAPVAAVHMALGGLRAEVSLDRYQELCEVVLIRTRAWNRQGEGALKNIDDVVGANVRATEGQRLFAVGFWLLYSILQREPTKEEVPAAVPLASLLQQGFEGWWTNGRGAS